ncbi:hybrid sensor histidine kinase/response regulator [Pseudoduganella flava]|nr:Hpt domain-containing protein [Pseudoduganella flava]
MSTFSFDPGPLSWVMGEIREALGRSRTALFEAGGQEPEDQATALRLAKSHLHQAHGALQMVDIEGVAAITRLAEEALDRFQDGTVKCSADHVQAIGELYGALVEYLEELLDGAPHQSVRLFPYYAAVQKILGAPRIHPADLFFPDLTRTPPLPEAPATENVDFGALRLRFERALLPYLKSGDPAQAQPLADVIAEVAAAQDTPRGQVFWRALQAGAELVAQGRVAGGVYVKQLLGAANLQMRRLAQGAPEWPDAVLRDALFCIAAADATDLPPLAQALRTGFGLDGMVPADYEAKRYGQVDPEALARAKEGLAQARTAWQRLEQGEDGQSEIVQALALVAAASDKLGVTALAVLMRQLAVVANTAAAAGRSEALGLEMATALLFAGHGLDQIRHLPDDFAASADTIAARLQALVAGEEPPEPAQWQQGLAQRLRQDDTVVALAQEMKTALREVERVLDEFDADPSQRAQLAPLAGVLHQLEGALAIADQPHAQQAAAHVRGQVATLASGDTGADRQLLEQIAQNVGALGFFVDMLAQNAAGARERFAFDAAQGTFRAVPLKKLAAAESIPVLEEQVPPPAEPAPADVPAGVPFATDSAIEEELLEIFIGEAQEVLAFIDATLAKPRLDAGTPESLAMLRRSFHTLKGSGRMVGLNQFADAAGAIEKVMNAWLAEARPVSEALFGLLEWVAAELNAWVGELVAKAISPRGAAPVVQAAARVQEGGPFVLPEAPRPVAPPPAEPYVTDENATEESAAAAPEMQAEVQSEAQPEPPQAPADDMRFVGRLAVPAPLFDIYVNEATTLTQALARDFGAWRAQGELAAETQHAAHTLTGISGTVGFKALRELAYALETTLQAAPPALPDPAHHDLFDFAAARAGQMVASFAAGDMPPEQPELIGALEQLGDELARTQAGGAELEARLDSLLEPTPAAVPATPPAPVDELAAKLDALFTDTYHALIADPPPVPPRGAPLPLRPKLADQDESIDDLFAAAFDDAFAEPPLTQAVPTALTLVPPLPPADEEPLVAGTPAEAGEEMEEAEPPAAAEAPVQPEESPPAEPPLPVLPLPEPEPDIPAVADELDPDLLPVFLEEGADLLPQVGAALRAWQHAPLEAEHAATVQRVLHTLKGSARMAGAMRLGQHAHEMETHIEAMDNPTPQAFEELLAHYDHALLLFEQLQHPPLPVPATAPAEAQVTGEAEPPAHAPLVRVRADILDRLVNQAGEVSISRSRLENEVGTLRTALADFQENLGRLRRQLREVEMQAESQIASRLSIAGEREFDPLEFDRFTRLQELTRMMAESVDDVGSFHEGLVRSVDSASDDLVQQARMTRELQRDLMRVRMVPFASIAERLYRVARQSAKELDKRVNLDIRGGTVEMDRGVLERMAGPFEHLLRNAIVHGIEPRDARAAAGKDETGEVLVQASQQGNEVVLEFADDGAGLDLERIRAKARALGLLGEDDETTDAEVANLIFEPGFSTADAVTELAGRGVGMDVVRSEAQALGGRIATDTAPGQGTRFTIHLPLTLAVTQVVLLAAGGKTHAVPAALVEQVLQVKEAALDGTFDVASQPLALHYLPALLGDAQARPLAQRSVPVLVLRAGTDRLALRVDEVLGNREVVVKNTGPQLARVPGIAGATVLGSGEIVLILNPVVLAQHMDQHPELRAPAPVLHAAAGTIMVVDDSLTVRKVTQRLLEREGYTVLLAKDGVDALEQLGERKPDLMLVDIEMPRMDGFDLTRHVRADPATQAIPIIMITSRSADKHRNVALQLGVNAYFGKPFQETILLGAIAGLLPVQGGLGESGER